MWTLDLTLYYQIIALHHKHHKNTNIILILISTGARMARFELIKENCSFSHSPIGKRLTFPWKTDLFKGIIKVVSSEITIAFSSQM